jgi:hypothetical protein
MQHSLLNFSLVLKPEKNYTTMKTRSFVSICNTMILSYYKIMWYISTWESYKSFYI